TVKQPWFLSTTAIVIYILFLVLGLYLIVDYYKWKWQMKMQLKYEHAEAERLKKLNAFKTKLYTNISHEFRTPLTLISGPIEQQLEKEHLNETDKKALNLVKKNSDRLLKLVDQLLDLSKLESGNLNLAVKKGDLGLLLNQLGETFRFKAKEKQIAFDETIEEMENVWFDRDVIEKIVTNLLSNAVKYTPTSGYIKYHASLKDGQLILAFLNNGNDLSGEDLSKLFKRYFQRNRDAEGAGIGLSLVKELVALNHGNIVVSALNEDDIQFTVTLPVEKSFFTSSEIIEENTVPVEMTEDNNAEGIQHINGDRPVLQIIEDDEDLRAYIVSIFKNEYKIVQAADGEAGINQALEHIPDVIVSDVMMPKVDGIELCETLKKDHRTNHIPIILLTAKSGEKNEMRGIEMGADAYITKPFNHNRLKLRVNKLIELRRALQRHYRGELPSMEVGELNSGDKEFIGNLESIVNENMNDPEFNSESLSDKLLMSRMQLHRKLKAILGTSTSNYIRDARLKQASILLKKNDLSVSEVAYEVGFNTPSYFIRTFKKAYNYTPKEYHSKYTNS
ncbi:MAG: response regulator, partial [Flavobacteriaceae bacterium]|nr:response regulator [Flavobacteriaceae bacterium]